MINYIINKLICFSLITLILLVFYSLLQGSCTTLKKESHRIADPTPFNTPLPTPLLSTPLSTPDTVDSPLFPEGYHTKAGDCWIEIPAESMYAGEEFIAVIHLNSGEQKPAAYGFSVFFDPSNVSINKNRGSNGIEAGKDGFVCAVNTNQQNAIIIVGFDTIGKNPVKDLQFLIIHFNAISRGNVLISLVVHDLTDVYTNSIGVPQGYSAKVEIK
jgi:hypothetical protein